MNKALHHHPLLSHGVIALGWPIVVVLSYTLFPAQPAVRLAIARGVLLGISVQLLALGLQHRRLLRHRVQQFFTVTTHPLNLAVFRIVFFASFFLSIDPGQVVWFSQLPEQLQFAPSGWGGLLEILPLSPPWAWSASQLCRLFALTALIGLRTRTSALLTAILGIYVLGIPQFFGKVNHYHHLIWFALVLAASRCGDAFSIDAVTAAWKRADRREIEPPGPAQSYALPLRWVWLLMGVIYFFPGFWKLALSGFDWAFSDNFKFQLYAKWLELGGWQPFFRLDQYPLLYQPMALGAILFELSFIALIFWPRLRPLAIVGGLGFHTMVGLFMQITSFWTLQVSYVAFLDWQRLCYRLGQWLYPQELFFIYDGNCRLCRRAIATLRVFDSLGRVNYVNALDDVALTRHELDWLDREALLQDLHAVVQGKTWAGFPAYRTLATRIPLLWPLLPLLYLWPIPVWGQQIYRRVADRRSCLLSTPSPAPTVQPGSYRSDRLKNRAVLWVGICLVAINSLFGMVGVYRSWPFALYPPFALLATAEVTSLEILALDPEGTVIPFRTEPLREHLGGDRLEGLFDSILSNPHSSLQQSSSPAWVQTLTAFILGGVDSPAQQRARLQALWQVAVQEDPRLQQATTVQFYRVLRSTLPNHSSHPPLQRTLLLEWQPKS
jgi:predicted DCC family thiol-disulfide oxidoreductase YuxK